MCGDKLELPEILKAKAKFRKFRRKNNQIKGVLYLRHSKHEKTHPPALNEVCAPTIGKNEQFDTTFKHSTNVAAIEDSTSISSLTMSMWSHSHYGPPTGCLLLYGIHWCHSRWCILPLQFQYLIKE